MAVPFCRQGTEPVYGRVRALLQLLDRMPGLSLSDSRAGFLRRYAGTGGFILARGWGLYLVRACRQAAAKFAEPHSGTNAGRNLVTPGGRGALYRRTQWPRRLSRRRSPSAITTMRRKTPPTRPASFVTGASAQSCCLGSTARANRPGCWRKILATIKIAALSFWTLKAELTAQTRRIRQQICGAENYKTVNPYNMLDLGSGRFQPASPASIPTTICFTTRPSC